MLLIALPNRCLAPDGFNGDEDLVASRGRHYDGDWSIVWYGNQNGALIREHLIDTDRHGGFFRLGLKVVDADQDGDVDIFSVNQWNGKLVFHENQLRHPISSPGDVNRDGLINNLDIDRVFAAIAANDQDASFDVNHDDVVNADDSKFLIERILRTTAGDANLDLVFDSSDLVSVFQAARYETGESAGWAEGDWNGDGVFDSSDLVAAFQSGSYEAAGNHAVR